MLGYIEECLTCCEPGAGRAPHPTARLAAGPGSVDGCRATEFRPIRFLCAFLVPGVNTGPRGSRGRLIRPIPPAGRRRSRRPGAVWEAGAGPGAAARPCAASACGCTKSSGPPRVGSSPAGRRPASSAGSASCRWSPSAPPGLGFTGSRSMARIRKAHESRRLTPRQLEILTLIRDGRRRDG